MKQSSNLKLLAGKNLSFNEAKKLFLAIFRQQLSEQEIKTVLLLLSAKGESVDEIAGCVSALEALEPKIKCKTKGLLDTCGTGGDGSHSINVSTLAAFVIAGAGGKVAKHGNRSISSKCGSSDLMDALGVNLAASPSKMLRSIDRHGIGYFHAPFYHPVFAKVQPLRKKLGVRTIFNFLGPMVNPLKLQYQLVGVSNKAVLPIYSSILKRKNLRRAWVCHSSDGLDEISIKAFTTIYDVTSKKSQIKKIHPKQVGVTTKNIRSLKGGTISQNRAFALKFLKGKVCNAASSMILLNAAAGLTICGLATSLRGGYQLASETVKRGKAFKALEGLRHATR